MPHLIRARHSLPDIVATIPADQWSLSEAERQRCEHLADKLVAYHPDAFITGAEPKTIVTGRIVADLLGKPCETVEGLHEHDWNPFLTGDGWDVQLSRYWLYQGSVF